MLELKGDLWYYHSLKRWVVITTNGDVRKNGACVMGRGTARQAVSHFPKLSYELGSRLKDTGNHVYVFDDYKIITLPVKHSWREAANLNLIKRSLIELVSWANSSPRKHGKFYLPRAGCGNGKLDWVDVKPLYEKYLDDRFVVVYQNEKVKMPSTPSELSDVSGVFD